MRGHSFHGWLAAGLFFVSGMAQAQNRIPRAIDPARVVALSGHVHPLARPEFDRGPVDPSFPIPSVILGLKLSAAQQADLQTLLAAQQNRASPQYRRWISPDQFAAQFGASQADVDQTTSWLRGQGLTVQAVARTRNWIAFGGTAEQVGRALHTEFHHYQMDGQTHFAAAVDPSLPEALAPVVSGLLGLHDYHPRHAQRGITSAPNGSVAPADLAEIYDFAPLYQAGIDGTGQSMAIAGESKVSASDINLFRAQFGLPGIIQLTQTLFGSKPPASSAAEREADLDVEWAGAVAPNAQITLVYSIDAFYSLIYAIDQNIAPVLSLSFGECELYATSDALLFQNVMQQGNVQGITVVASAGDGGPATCDHWFTNPVAANGLSVSFPASIPEVTAVGGTQFSEGRGNYWSSTADANGAFALSYIPEAVWNETAAYGALAAGGGGASAVFSKPAWQAGPGVPDDNARDLPDISLAASSVHDPYLLSTNGSCGFSGGTSASVQVFAGVLALLNHYLTAQGVLAQPGLGNINPVLYRMAESAPGAFHDIVLGGNTVPCVIGTPDCMGGGMGYGAGPGYDLASGLGSLDVYRLATRWDQHPQTTPGVTLSLTPSAATLNDTLQLAATVQAPSEGLTPTGQVTFYEWGAAIPATVQLTGGTLLGSAALTGSQGAATATLAVPASQLGLGAGTVVASYSGDANYNGGGASAPVTLSLPASGSAVVPSATPSAVPEDGSTTHWFYTLTLRELAGTGTTLTGFSIAGIDQSSAIADYFGRASIGPRGSISASIEAKGLTPPVTRVFTFGGTDADGTTWNRTMSVPFLGSQRFLELSAVSNAASAGPRMAPGMLASVYGNALAPATASAGALPLPDTLGGTSVTVNGVAAPLIYASPGQLNVQVPYETQPGIGVLTVNNGVETASYSLRVQIAAPGIFTNVRNNLVPDASGTHGSTLPLFITGAGQTTPAVATGAGPADPNNLPQPLDGVQVTIGGVAAPVQFIGIPTWSAGVTQINFTVPAAAPLRVQTVIVTVGGVASAPATFTVLQ